jgi:phosphatidylglycerol lysyltransferase
MTTVPKSGGMLRAGRPHEARSRLVPLLWLVLLVGSTVYFLLRARAETGRAARGLLTADPRWVGVALVTQIAVLALIGVKYRVILRRLGYRVPAAAMARTHLRRHVVATVLPFGGAPSLVSFARDLGAYGASNDDALFAAMLSSIVSETAFVLFLLPVLAGLLLSHRVTGPVIVGALLLVGLVVALFVVLAVLLRDGPVRMAGGRLPRRVAAFVERIRGHGLTGCDLLLPVALNLAVNAVGVTTLFAALRAVGESPSLWTVLVARVVGAVFMLITPFMQGAGAVEFSVVAMLRQAGTPAAAALAATLLFRVAQFWFPFALGIAAFARTDRVRPVLSRHRLRSIVAVSTGSAAILVVAGLIAATDVDRLPLADDRELVWLPAIGAVLLLAATVFVGPAGRLRRAPGRQRIE